MTNKKITDLFDPHIEENGISGDYELSDNSFYGYGSVVLPNGYTTRQLFDIASNKKKKNNIQIAVTNTNWRYNPIYRDLDGITDPQYRAIYIDLIDDFELNRKTYKNSNLNKPIYFNKWNNYIKFCENVLHYTFYKQYIVYNEKDDLAIRGRDEIWLTADYVIYKTKSEKERPNDIIKKFSALKGEIHRQEYESTLTLFNTKGLDEKRGDKKTYITASGLIQEYAKLFKKILWGNLSNGDQKYKVPFELLLYHVNKFAMQNIELSECLISPLNIYSLTYKIWSPQTESSKQPNNHSRFRKGNYFLKPGSEKAKAEYKRIKTKQRREEKKCNIINTFRRMKEIQNIINISDSDKEMTVDNALKSYKAVNAKGIRKNEFMELLNELLEEQREHKIKDEDIEVFPLENKRKEHKEQNTETRKNHKEWMDKLKELMSKEDNIDYQYFCDLYKGIIELPKRKTFNDYKRRLKSTSHQVF